MTGTALQKSLRAFASEERAQANQWFFKTGPGSYGEGDIFIGVTVPDIRKVAKQYHDADFETISAQLASPYHEDRVLGLLILVEQSRKADEKMHKKIVDFYLNKRKGVNNWDLVDLSAPRILGRYLYEYKKPTNILYTFAHSKNLWEKRIAVLATFWFISKNDFKDALTIAEILLNDEHDLIQKAVGWMLREVGKRDLLAEEVFLKTHLHGMPRTMLRYAIEKFPEAKRQAYVTGSIL